MLQDVAAHRSRTGSGGVWYCNGVMTNLRPYQMGILTTPAMATTTSVKLMSILALPDTMLRISDTILHTMLPMFPILMVAIVCKKEERRLRCCHGRGLRNGCLVFELI